MDRAKYIAVFIFLGVLAVAGGIFILSNKNSQTNQPLATRDPKVQLQERQLLRQVRRELRLLWKTN